MSHRAMSMRLAEQLQVPAKYLLERFQNIFERTSSVRIGSMPVMTGAASRLMNSRMP